MTCMPPKIPPVSWVAIPEDNEQLNQEITRLAGHINAAQYRFLKLLAALIERDAWNGNGIKSPVHWLNYYCGISLGPAREKVRVAQCLKSLPLIDAAFARGEISYSKVRAMTRSATPENEHYLLEIARCGTASHVEKLVRKHQAVKRREADEQDKPPEFSYYYDDDGMLVFRGRLRPEDGAVFIKAMQATMDQLNEKTFQQKRVSEQDKAENVSAETFCEEEQLSYPQKRADALVHLAEHYLTGGGNGHSALTGGDKYQVMLHIHAGADEQTTDSYIDGGPTLPPATVQRLVCDASRVTVAEDAAGNVLNIGRKTRTVPPAMRRALQVRDQGCRFPGCCETRFVDAHHIHHWSRGGETSLDNLVLLCRHHHRLMHEGGYEIVRGDNQELVFLDQQGHVLQPSLYPQFAMKNVSAETFLEIEQENKELGLAIDPGTAVTAWQGEVMDYGMGVEVLINLSV